MLERCPYGQPGDQRWVGETWNPCRSGEPKTGFTNEAGRCIVVEANMANGPVIIALLGAGSSGARSADLTAIRNWLAGNETPVAAPLLCYTSASIHHRKPRAMPRNSHMRLIALAASAAYWIGSAAGEFYVTPGGEAGSIGVYAAHINRSAQLRKAGVDTTLVSAGKYKVEGSLYEPLSKDAERFMQSRVDDYYAKFTRAVARHRGVSVLAVRNGMGQGRLLGAQAAKAAGMVDDVATFDDVVRRLLSSRQSSSSPGSNSLRLRQLDLAALTRFVTVSEAHRR